MKNMHLFREKDLKLCEIISFFETISTRVDNCVSKRENVLNNLLTIIMLMCY